MTAPIEEDPMLTRAKSRVGMVLQDKWRLDRLLGVGGMAAVYAATHRNQKRVAVKMLHAEFCQEGEMRTRFLREGYAANAVEHEGAVSVLDDDVAADGAAFLVMELLEGETLEQRWERKAHGLELREVLIVAEQLLDVLAAAHAKEIVHRDIKPENLFLTRQGTLKVLDFGIARVFEARETQKQTRAGTVMGTPAFMAPEQARARWDEVDGRTDLWAVGATMFTLLSGRYVHEAKTGNEQLIFSATTPARSIATVVSGLPRSVVATIDRALAFDREHRWPNATAMREAVRGSLEALDAADGAQPSVPSPRLSMPSGLDAGQVTVLGTGAPDIARAPTQMSDWASERDVQAAEVGRLRPHVAQLTQRASETKAHVAAVQAKIAAAHTERTELERWFKRQAGTRTAAVEESRKMVKSHLCDLARRAIAEPATYESDFDAARADIARLGRAAEARAHDVRIHEAAIVSFDRAVYKKGLIVGIVAAFLAAALIIVPIVLRATLPAPPPVLPSVPASSD